jgi:hypothetical protein
MVTTGVFTGSLFHILLVIDKVYQTITKTIVCSHLEMIKPSMAGKASDLKKLSEKETVGTGVTTRSHTSKGILLALLD